MFVCGGGSTFANGAYTYTGMHNGANDMRNEHGYELWKYVAPGLQMRSFWTITRKSGERRSWLYESDEVAGDADTTDFTTKPLPAVWSVQSGGMDPAPIISSVQCPKRWVCGAAAADVNGEFTISGAVHNGAVQFRNAHGARMWRMAATGGSAHHWMISAFTEAGVLEQLYRSDLDLTAPASMLPPSSATQRWSVMASADGRGPTVRDDSC